MELDALDTKALAAFPGKVVRKDLLQQIKGGENVPSYVLEYLLGRYCASDDEAEIQAGIAAVKDQLRQHYFRQDESNKAQAMVEREGRHRFLDRVEVRFVASESKYWASLDNFGFQRIHVPDEFHRRYERLLEGGVWALVDLEFHAPEETGKGASPFHIADLRPIQLARFDLDEFCAARRALSTGEWLDLLTRSVGLEPARLSERQKLLLLTRLIAFVEKNYNFIELGPRGTGKSYAFSEFSPYGILVSGGKASTANLFYNNARRQVGLVGHWDVVAFDEVGGMKVTDPDALQIMKDYMANGRFSRGITQVYADASLAFVGNLNHPVETLVANAGMDLFQPLPKEFDLALIDRFHCYLPGWELPKNSPGLLTKHYGFVTDYLAEAFRALRRQNRFDLLEGRIRLGAHVEGRDASAVRRTVSGLAKLLHPGGEVDDDALPPLVELALECRRRVKEQLKKRGAFEFHKTTFSYRRMADEREIIVGVPEQRTRFAIPSDPLPAGAVHIAVCGAESRVGLFRLEVATSAGGTGKLRVPGTLPRLMKESLLRAWALLEVSGGRLGLSPQGTQQDFAVEAIDLSGGGADGDCGVGFFLALASAMLAKPLLPGLVVLGDLSLQGHAKPCPSIVEPLQVARDSGASRVLVPIGNKGQVTMVSEEGGDDLDLVFFADADRALSKGFGL